MIIVDEFKNIIADYFDGKYNEETVKKYLDRAAEKVDKVLIEEK